MTIAVIAEDEGWRECAIRLGERHSEALHCKTAAGIIGVPDVIFYLRDENRLEDEMTILKSFECPIFCNALTYIPKEDNSIIIRLNGWPGFLLSETIEVATIEEHKPTAGRILDQLGWKYLWVPNVIGLITARIIATIINEAYYALGDGVSEKNEIDTAMRLGTNYPKGPFEWSEQIGIKNIFVLLSKLSETNKRYTPASQLLYESDNSWH